jgi:hypothetical protein
MMSWKRAVYFFLLLGVSGLVLFGLPDALVWVAVRVLI